MTLDEFLLARIAEDEALAKRYAEGLYDSARVLAECAAKRAIVKLHAECDREGYTNAVAYLTDALGALASVYADHEDYDPDWVV